MDACRQNYPGTVFYRTEYHTVSIPKCRRRMLNPGVKGYISRLFPKVLRGMPGCEIVEQNIQVDHIRLLMVIPPKYAVSEVIGQMKQYTASRLREKSAWLEKLDCYDMRVCELLSSVYAKEKI